MNQLSRRGMLRNLIKACLAGSLVVPLIAHAQDQTSRDIEEVVVTGSFIRNSAFAQNSPVDTVSQTDLYESGAPNMSAYIRDLSYTQNINAVNNVLGGASGPQTGVGASFNLRGLGENSTLTLIDGARTLNPTMNTSMPEIALDRMELVLDGGSALYGSDAVAGVVNLIPIKEFDGVRVRSYYQRTQDGAMENYSNSVLWGRSFRNDINYVGALEYQKQTPLMMYERPREMRISSQTSISGNPGSFRQVEGATSVPYDYHGGTHVGPVMLDPSCETFNEGSPSFGMGSNAMPSGYRHPANFCTFEYGLQHTFAPHQDVFNLYNTVTVDAADWLRLNATIDNHYRLSENRTTSTSPNGDMDRNVALVLADHPANPYGVDVVPWAWRPFAQAYTHQPEHFDPDSSRRTDAHYSLNRVKVSADFDIVGSWTGYTFFTKQSSKNAGDQSRIDTGRLQAALLGQGGPNGDEYFNPFGSSDPRSPYFVAGVTDNSKEMTEWLWYHENSLTTARDELDLFEAVVTGDLFDLPFGTVAMAAGYQWRDLVQHRYAAPREKLQRGINYEYTSVASPIATDNTYYSEVNSFFAELQAPLLETVDLQVAVRHEDFKTFNLSATSPKVALRWEALPTLAVRASWGESFLAPTPVQSRPFIPDENCNDMWSGRDDLTGTLLIGGQVCSSGNPNLRPESSTITNIGFTWEPEGALDGFSLSMDYQDITYEDRIRSLSQQDTTLNQFRQMLRDTGISAANYDPTPGSPTRQQADAWLAGLGNIAGNPIERNADGTVARVYTQAANVSAVWIDLVDITARYRMDTQNLGTFTTTLQASHFMNYEYLGAAGTRRNALGQQNGDTGIVPPLPEWKGNLRLSWFRDNHSASVSGNYWSSVSFDSQVINMYPTVRSLPVPDTLNGEYIVDARYGIELNQFFNSEITVSTGVNNLFNKRPQRAGILGGFESRLSTPWGRQFWVSMEWRPGF